MEANIEALSGTMVFCRTCKEEISLGVFFCPHCGGAQLQAMLTPGNTKAASTTTANYDPKAPDYKPWRETDHMLNKPHPKMPPQLGGQGGMGPNNNTNLAPLAPVPWRPTMKTYIHGVDGDKKKRQLEGIKRKELLLKNSNRKLLLPGAADSSDADDNHTLAGGRSRASLPGSVNGSVDGDGAGSILAADGQPIPLDSLPEGHHGAVVYFKQHAFQRRHGKRKPAVPKQLDPIALKLQEEAESDQHYVRGEQTFVHAVAAYDAQWLVEPGFTIHLSLIDRSHDDKEEFVSRYFLRVGVVYEHMEMRIPQDAADANPCTAEPEEVVVCSDLMVLDVIQNDLGRLLTSPKQSWVDLNLIKPDEYYMATFLQQSLAYIAQRVHASPSLTMINLIDQVCLVEPVYDTAELEREGGVPQMAVITEQDIGLFRRRHKRALKRQKQEQAYARKRQKEQEESGEPEALSASAEGAEGVGASNVNTDLPPLTPGRATPRRTQRKQALAPTSRPGTATTTTLGEPSQVKNRSSSVALGPPGREMNLTLEKTLAQKACKIRIGQLWEDQQVIGMARLSIRYPDAEQLLHDTLPKRQGEHDVLFSEVPATQVVISLLPMYSPVKVQPKMLSFDVPALRVLLGSALDIDAALKDGFGALNKLLTAIVQLLNFTKTTTINQLAGDEAVVEEVYKLGITGVATVPFEKPPVTYDSDSDSEEAAGVATIDCLREVANRLLTDVAKEVLVAELKAAEDEKIRREEEAAALEELQRESTTKIQTIVRRKSVQTKGILEAKRQDRKELKAKAEKGALAMQCVGRMYLAKVWVQKRRQEVAREALDAAMTEKWVESMGMHLEVETEETVEGSDVTSSASGADAAAAIDINTATAESANDLAEVGDPQSVSPSASPNRDAINAWRDAYEKRSLENSPEKANSPWKGFKSVSATYDRCPCHQHATYHFDTELKDTQVKIYGLYNCGSICEHSIHGDRAAIKTMYTDANTMMYMQSKGNGQWTLELTVLEVPEGEEGDEPLTQEEAANLSARVHIESAALEEIAANLNHEITMMELENQEKDEIDKKDAKREREAAIALSGGGGGSVGDDASQTSLVMTVEEEAQWQLDEKEQRDWEVQQEGGKTQAQMDREAEENAKMEALTSTLSKEEKDQRVARVTLHNLLLNHEHKKELFRRACAGISISWRYDGALEATFNLELVMEMYEVFYDEEGDLVVGI